MVRGKGGVQTALEGRNSHLYMQIERGNLGNPSVLSQESQKRLEMVRKYKKGEEGEGRDGQK